MKKIFKNGIKKFKNIWKNNPMDIIIPIVCILIFIIACFTIGITGGLIIFVALIVIYFIGNFIFNKKKKKKDKIKSKNTNKKKKKSKEKNERIYKKQKKVKTKKKKKKILKIILLIFLTLFILGVIAVIGFLTYIVINAPTFDEKLLYVSEPTIVLSSDGKEIGKLGTEKRVILTYDELPEVLIDAILATEDSRFFNHNGVDWARFLKASAYQLVGMSDAGGASTITMQVSKKAYTDDNNEGIEGIIRKFTDVYVSMFILEKNYTKEQIMEFYVNSQWLGKRTYGVEQTALTYFGKSAKELNLAEAAMMAGLFQAPGKYDPYTNPEATEKRRQTVLSLMLRHGYITKDEYNLAKKMTVEKIVIPKEESLYVSGEISPYQSFIDTVVEEVQDKTGKNPYTTSMTIYTTLNTDFQDYINKIMDGSSYNWDNDLAQGGIVVTDVKNGSVVAIGGNRKIDSIDTYNYATDTENQIGSTAKPLYDYGPAIEFNNWSSGQIIVDEPTTYSDGNQINNWDRNYQGLETIRTALAGSRNIPALKTFKLNNKAKIIEFVEKLGLSPEIYTCSKGYTRKGKQCINDNDPDDIVQAKKANTLHEAHAIGGYNGESPLTMASAYAAFANGGTYIKPYTFTKVVFQDTNEEYVNNIEKTKAMSEETAYIISDMLVTTAHQAMGRYHEVNGVEYAAKTGTTNYDEAKLKAHGLLYTDAVNDLWAVGFNTEYSIAVWHGYDRINSKYYNRLSVPSNTKLFQAVAKKIFTNKARFKQPSGVVAVEIESGCAEAMLPSEYTPSDLRQTELFIKGTEPTSVSQRFTKLSDVSNLSANVADNVVTLTWNSVNTPDINTEAGLRKAYASLFSDQGYLNSYISSRLSYNKSYLGNIGYNIYLKKSDGSLTLLDFVTSNKYETTIDVAGNYTIVVKTAYSIFKSNMSDGKSVSVTIEKDSPLIPTDPDDGNGDNNDENKEPDQP